jgi:hypothetical protein
MIEIVSTSQTSVSLYETTRRRIPEDWMGIGSTQTLSRHSLLYFALQDKFGYSTSTRGLGSPKCRHQIVRKINYATELQICTIYLYRAHSLIS